MFRAGTSAAPTVFRGVTKGFGDTPQEDKGHVFLCAAVESPQQDIGVASRLWERLAVILCGSKKKSLGKVKPFRLQVSISAERK